MIQFKKIILIFVPLFVLFYFICNFYNENVLIYAPNYYCILALTFFILFLLIYVLLIKKADIFEPIIILLVLYLLIFGIRPLNDIINGEIYTMGVNVMYSSIYSCFIVFLSLISFCLGYYNKFKINNKTKAKCEAMQFIETVEYKKKVLFMSYLIWIISFLFCLLGLVISGKSLSYIFSFGNKGFINNNSSEIAALTFFSYSLIAPWLYINIYEKNKLIKIVVTCLMLIIYIIKGTRIVLLMMALSIIIYHYLKKNERPKVSTILVSVFIGLLFMSFIQMIRSGLRSGNSINSSFKEVAITNVFDADLTTYKQFYCIVNRYPSRYNYTFGKAMLLQTIITIIPRNFWPSKPEPVITKVIGNSVNELAVVSGLAAPGIAEYYFEFGVIGCILCMFILGLLFKKWKQLIKNGNNISNIRYAILYGIIFQIVIRTSTTSCIYQYLFSMVPIYLINNVTFNKYDKLKEN